MRNRFRIKKSTIHTLFKWVSVFVVVNYSVGTLLLSSFVIPQKIADAATPVAPPAGTTIDLTKTAGFYYENSSDNKRTTLNYKYQSGTVVSFGYLGNYSFKPSIEGVSQGKMYNGSPSHSAFGTTLQPVLLVKQSGDSYGVFASGYYSPKKPSSTKDSTIFEATPNPGNTPNYVTIPGSADYATIKAGGPKVGESASDKLVYFMKAAPDAPIYAAKPTDPNNLPPPGKPTQESDQQTQEEIGKEQDAAAGTSPGEECPLTQGGFHWFTDNILMKPICAATNLIASAATAIASWTITTFFVPALGLT